VHHVRRTFVSVFLSVILVLTSLASASALPRLLIDMRTSEILFEQDAGAPWHPASLTKLMTGLLAFEAIESGRVTLDTPVVTSANALSAPPSKMGYPVDTAIRLEDALYILMIKSANDIAIAVAETIGGTEGAFVAMMNQRAAQMGLTGTHFTNPHGLHDPAQVTTARDMAIIALTIRNRFPQYDAMFVTQTVQHGSSRSSTNNILLSKFAGADGMKTGYICASGLNIVATANRGGRQLMAVMFGGNSSRERGEMTAQMLYSGYAGGYRGTGRSVIEIANRTDVGPVDMRPMICGAQANQYDTARREEFPLGLEGQLSYLNDTVEPIVYAMNTLGRVRDVPLPRPRPIGLGGTALQSAEVPSEANPMGDASSSPTLNYDLSAPVPIPRPSF
jgi:D-alanyl-D-alanine carboxypeptidase